MSIYTATCSVCAFTEEIVERRTYAYKLSGTLRVYMFTQFAWCPVCSCIVRAEKLMGSDMIDQFIAGIDKPAFTRDLERYRQVMLNRQSLARCLDCGSMDIVAAMHGEHEQYELPHPGCEGKITMEPDGQLTPWAMYSVYTTEGAYVGEEEGYAYLGSRH